MSIIRSLVTSRRCLSPLVVGLIEANLGSRRGLQVASQAGSTDPPIPAPFHSPIIRPRHHLHPIEYETRHRNDPIGVSTKQNPPPQLLEAPPPAGPEQYLQKVKDAVKSGSQEAALASGLRYLEFLADPNRATSSRHAPTARLVEEVLWLCLDQPNLAWPLFTVLEKARVLKLIAEPSSTFTIQLAHRVIKDPSQACLSSLESIIGPMRRFGPKNKLARITKALLDHRRFPARSVKQFFLDEVAGLSVEKTSLLPLRLWLAILYGLDYRDGLTFFGEFRRHLEERRQAKGEFSTAEGIVIAKVYATLLQLWVESRFPNEGNRNTRIKSEIPSKITHDLLGLLGDPKYLDTFYLNVWMGAERVALNYDQALSIWNMFDRSSRLAFPLKKPATAGEGQGDAGWMVPSADAESYIEYLQLIRVPKIGEAQLPIRKILRVMTRNLSLDGMNTDLLNAVLTLLTQPSHLSSVMPDLPLWLLVLRLYDWDPAHDFGPPPNARTINVVASGLIRLWRTQGQLLDPVFLGHSARWTRKRVGLINKSRRTIMDVEWKLIANTVADIIPTDEHSVVFGQTDRSILPLRRSPTQLHDADLRSSPGNISQDLLDVDRQTTSLIPSSGIDLSISSVSTKGNRTPAHCLLRPMMKLVERSIKLFIAQRVDNDSQVDAGFEKLMENVYEEVLPQQSETWLDEIAQSDDGLQALSEVATRSDLRTSL